jgi:invasion protein IalB
MTHRLSLTASLALAALLTPLAASAQTTEAPANAAPANAPYQAASHGDWQILCTPLGEGQPEYCEGYQLLNDAQGSPIAEISLEALPLGAEFAAGATVTTPLETFLPTGLGFRVGEAEQMRLEPFRVCTVVGCIVRMGISFDEIDAMKAGSTATVTIAPFVAVDQPVDITISLTGFTAMFEDLQTRLSLAAAAARSGN